ncbi:hypothetical protein [Parahaliea maris]|nr:hypothetical protein [Parahaliea maris]
MSRHRSNCPIARTLDVPTEKGQSVNGVLRSLREFGEQHLCGRVPG